MEVDGVAKADYWKVVDHCYLCDLCYMTKCPYVPPHEWNLDFPHLMLRAKAFKFKKQGAPLRDKLLTSTVEVGNVVGLPVVADLVNAVNKIGPARAVLESVIGISADARLPEFHSNTLQKRMAGHSSSHSPTPAGRTTGKVALFATCFMNRNEPGPGEDLVAVF
jgi:Fe-S oxidoreductase